MRTAIGSRSALSVAALLATACFATGQHFPDAPRSVDEAEALGLKRVHAEALATVYGGVREAKNLKGEVSRQELRSDGSLYYTNDSGVSGTGTWELVPDNGGMICRAFDFQGGRRFCTLYYAAPDGVHLFGYNPIDKLWRVTRRRAETP